MKLVPSDRSRSSSEGVDRRHMKPISSIAMYSFGAGLITSMLSASTNFDFCVFLIVPLTLNIGKHSSVIRHKQFLMTWQCSRYDLSIMIKLASLLEKHGKENGIKWKRESQHSDYHQIEIHFLDLKTNRVNYQTYLLMNYDQPCVPPSPLNHGWYVDSGSCRPTRYTRPAPPRNLGEVMRQMISWMIQETVIQMSMWANSARGF